MLSVNTNVAANISKMHSDYSEVKQQTSMARLSSGSRVNSASDDAAGMAVSSKMKSQIRGLNSVLRNVADGISLAQVADSSSQQISDIVIRLRELAIQNHNGIYTDQDRANAEKELTALVTQIDSIAEHTTFNSVNLLDGTYLQNLRTGNRNEETMGVDFARLSADSLGGAVVTTEVSTISQTSLPIDYQNLTEVEAFEAERVRIEASVLSTDFQNFITAAPNGNFTLSGDDASQFSVNSSGSISASAAIIYNKDSASDNTKSLSVTYTGSMGNSKTEQITLEIKQAVPSTPVIRTASSQLKSEEALNVEIKALAIPAGTNNNVLSAELVSYIDDFPGGSFSLEGTDSGQFSISQAGVVTGNLSYNSPQDADRDNFYDFAVKYEAPSGDSFLETISLEIESAAPSSVMGAHDPTTEEFISGTDMMVTAVVENGFVGEMVTIDLDGPANNDYTSFGFGTFFQDFVAEYGSGGTFSLQNISYTGMNSYDPALHNLSIEAGNILTLGGPNLADGLPTGDYNATLIYSVNGKDFTYDFQMFADPGLTPSISLTFSDTLPTSSITRFENIQMGSDNLQISVMDTPPTQFSMLNMMSGFAPGGSLSISNITAPAGGQTDQIELDGNNIILARDAVSGTYTADITYSVGPNSVTTTAEFVVAATPQPPCFREAGASITAIAGEATTIFRDNGGTQNSTNLRTVNSHIQADEAKKLSFSVFDEPAVTSTELKNFANQFPQGSFTLSGADAEHLTMDQNGLVKLIENADFERKAQYEFTINYENGANKFSDRISMSITDDTTDNVLHINDISIATAELAQEAVLVLDKALDQINRFQSYVGSIQNRLDSSLELTHVTLQNASKARGRMIDSDFAAETQSMATQQILSQSAQSVLAQATSAKQNILALIG